jgi:hypothetical protein
MHFQIIKSVSRHHAEHMVKKGNPRMQSVNTAAIQVQRHSDVSFGGTAVNAATAFHDSSSSCAIELRQTLVRRQHGVAFHDSPAAYVVNFYQTLVQRQYGAALR